ncbi:MAG: hypothetical protein KJ069_05040 [Anaerolineae bacterium]|nr:hypothetical protein [Anaerolineae bacterium]
MNLIYRFFIVVVSLFCGVWLVNSFFQALSPAVALNSINSEVIPARWDTHCVECPDSVGQIYNDRILRLDSDGNPHVVYGSRELYHSWHDGSQWQRELIDVSAQHFEYMAFALDTQDRPTAGYYDTADRSMKFAYQQNNSWITQTILAEGNPRPLTLTTDSANVPHVIFISYVYPGSTELRHAWRNSNGLWVNEIIALTELDIASASLVFGSNAQMHVTYNVNTNGTSGRGDYYLKYAWYDGSTWQTESVIHSGPWGFSHSLVIDEDDRLHISFMDGVGQTLQYGWRDNHVWQFETVEYVSKTGTQSSIAVDSSGQVHIGYYEFVDEYFDFRNFKVKHARYDGNHWIVEEVASEGILPEYSGISLALRGEQPLIVTYSHSIMIFSLHLRNAYGWEGSWIREDGGQPRAQSFALDSQNRPHLAYVVSYNTCQVWHTFFDGSDWQHTLLSHMSSCAYAPVSLAIDSHDRPHIVYVQEGFLMYAWFDNADWQIEALFSGVSDEKIALALDPENKPHILYLHDTEHIMHGWFNGTTWQEEAIYSYPYWLAGDIAVGSDGRVHVTFFEAGDGKYLLNHAWKDGAIWQIEPINEPGEGGVSHDLVLDALNQPHIVYVDTDHELRLVYTWENGGQWQSETVLINATYPSLMLDNYEQPHISYVTEIAPQRWQLRYVYTKDANWYDELINSNDAYLPQIATDSLGRPHVAWIRGGVMYSKRPLPLALHTTVSPMAEVTANDIMTYTITISAPNLNVQLWDPLSEAMTYITGTLTAPAVYSPTAHAISWQGTLLANEDMTFQFQATSALSGTELIPPLVNTTWLTETTTGEGISRTQIVNGKLRWLPIINLPND